MQHVLINHWKNKKNIPFSIWNFEFQNSKFSRCYSFVWIFGTHKEMWSPSWNRFGTDNVDKRATHYRPDGGHGTKSRDMKPTSTMGALERISCVHTASSMSRWKRWNTSPLFKLSFIFQQTGKEEQILGLHPRGCCRSPRNPWGFLFLFESNSKRESIRIDTSVGFRVEYLKYISESTL